MHPQMNSEAPDPRIVFDILMAHQRTSALKAAIDLGIFGAIGAGASDVASIAKKCSASERGIRIICDFLTINGVLAKENGSYRHTPASAVFLDPRSPACLASIATFLSNPLMAEPFGRLAEIVRSGHTSLPGEGSVSPDNPAWVEFAETMAPMMAPLTGPLSTIALAGQTGPMRVLDIAAGHGLFGIEAAKQNPEARVTGQDWAAVLNVAMKNARKAGVDDRYELLPGSAFDVNYGGPYDVVLLTNFLHHFDKPTNVALLKKVRAALKPGGRAATLEFVPNEDRVSPPMPAAFALSMLATTPSGDAYTLSELTAMYQEAGYNDIGGQAIPNSPHTVVLGRV